MPDLPRGDLVDMIAYALWHNRRLRPRRPDDGDEWRPLARAVAEHLELCGVETTRRPPAPMHSAGGGPDRGGATGTGPSDNG